MVWFAVARVDLWLFLLCEFRLSFLCCGFGMMIGGLL